MNNGERWVTIPGVDIYAISDLGRVKNTKTGKLIRTHPTKKGYWRVKMQSEGKQITRTLHGVVANAFVTKFRENVEPNHINGDKSDNRAENLEWLTHTENMRHAIVTGLFKPSGGKPKKPIMIVETGERFDSISDCARAIGGHNSLVSQALDHPRRQHLGFHFVSIERDA